MIRWMGVTALALAALVPAAARADYYVTPAPVVSYYSAPAVSYYTPAPVVSYYTPAPVVSYYTPAVSYYAAPTYYAPTTVSTYRYGLFGRHSVTTVGYGVPSYVAPAPVYRPSYYAAPVYRSYYVPVYP
jgi:hypothetical protein